MKFVCHNHPTAIDPVLAEGTGMSIMMDVLKKQLVWNKGIVMQGYSQSAL